MQQVVQVLKKTESFFDRAGIESPKVEAEWLLASVLGCKRLELYLQWDKPLNEDLLEQLRPLVKRRASGEPSQYVLGYSDFHDIRIPVAPGVLIPRPETELLVEFVLAHLKQIDSPRIVDLGTGSGAIALALANALPESRILAVEKSAGALEQARQNAETLGLRERVAFRSGDWLKNLSFEADCIVSNPPYLTNEEWEAARPEVKKHEPKEALVAANGGTEELRKIIRDAGTRLAPNGLLALEMGIDHGPTLSALARDYGYQEVLVKQDDNGRDRFLFARKG